MLRFAFRLALFGFFVLMAGAYVVYWLFTLLAILLAAVLNK